MDINNDKRIVLYGHTGSNNHGCEAIVRSTAALMNQAGIMVSGIATYHPEEDRKVGIDALGSLIEYRGYNGKQSVTRLVNGIFKKVFRYEYPYESFIQKDVLAAVKQYGATIVIGGDTYCYGRNACIPSYNLLKYAQHVNAKVFLWSCSIGAEDLDKEKISYLKQYNMIFPREGLTYGNLLKVGIPSDKMCLMSDSAFVLEAREITLPDGFTNVLAFNPSYTLGIGENREQIFNSRVTLLNYILNHSDMKVALIPHVYAEGQGDAQCAREIAEELEHQDRVFIFDQEYTCEELKYIISRCRFLVAERTHASIAGYSQLIPTFVIGYSAKSIGIARDLFGTDEGFVMSYKDVHNDEDLILPIMDFISREDDIHQRLERVIPAYKEKTVAAAKRLAALLE